MQRSYALGPCPLRLCVGNICDQDTDAIVNAANGSLLGGGGVDGAIHRAAGPQLLEACRQLRRSLPQGLATGEAVLTPGFHLRARFVIHCVGPIYTDRGDASPRLLACCYRQALRLCEQHELSSIAFPSISTGAYGYPVADAARIALTAVRDTVEAMSRPIQIRFVLFDERTGAAYEQAANELF